MRYIVRFHGSCGHQEDRESHEKFIEMSSPHMEYGAVSSGMVTCEVTTEGEDQVVHTYPGRYCVCYKCAMEILEADARDYRSK